ncbi:ATP-dependent Clp protease proteolytic subunit [Staphylococcus epidermidis]|nr:ATP-dependent Clp protease proteolytic subunit [Staphylococcus epidermidis]
MGQCKRPAQRSRLAGQNRRHPGDTYAAKTGKDIAAINDWMAAETWFTAAEAKEHGFADEVSESGKGLCAVESVCLRQRPKDARHASTG